MTAKQSPYDYVEQAPYYKVKHAPSLKGLLKPFKGKGDYVCQWPLLLIHFRPLKLTHLRSGFIHFLLQSIAFTSKHKYV